MGRKTPGDEFPLPKDFSTASEERFPLLRFSNEGSAKKKARTVAVTTEDMQKRRNNVKTFGGNEATRKTKKNQLKHQYGNFKAEGKEMLEQTFNRLQAIIKYEDINQIDKDDIKEMDIKWNMALLSMRADRFWKKTGKKISIQCTDVAGFDKSKVECFNCHKMGHFARECRAPRSQDRGRRENYKQEENHALVADEEAPTKFTLMAKSSSDSEDMSWTGLPEFADDTIADYSMPTPSIENETVRKSSVKYAKMYRKTSKSSNVRGNQRNWNNLKSQQLGKNFLMKNKACGDFDHLSYDCGKWVEKGKSIPKNNTHKSLPPRTVFHKSDRSPTRTTRPNMNATQPKRTSFYKPAHSYVKRPFQRRSAVRTQFWVPKVPIVSKNFPTVTQKFPTGNRSKESSAMLGPPQQNRIAERRNMTLIEAARTMLADAKFPITFWAEAVNTACYVQNRVLVNKSQNKNSYELFDGRTPTIGFVKPFGCHVMILNTFDHLGKFEAKGDEGYFIGYSMSSKAFRVFNKRTKRVEENLHVNFLENKLIKKRAGPNWLFDIDTLTNSMNYVPVVSAGTISTNFSAHLESSTSNAQYACKVDAPESSGIYNTTATLTNPLADQMETLTVETLILTVSSPVPTACLDDSPQLSSDTRLISNRVTSQDDTPSLDNILTLSDRFEDILRVTSNADDINGVEANLGNMENNISASPTPTFRIQKDHPTIQIIGSVDTLVQTRNKSKEIEEQSFIASIHHKTNPNLLQFCLFLCFLSQEEPKKNFDALKDPRVRPISTKWVLKYKKDEIGIVIRNKARLVAQGHTQEEGIDYKEVFAPVARIEAIRLFLAYASFMGFIVYQMDVKSAFLYGTIDEEVYVMQPLRFQDPEFPARVYKVEKAMYGLHQAPRAWYGTLSKYLLTNGFQRALMHEKFKMSAMGELNFFLGLQVLQKKEGIFLSQDKYVGDILKKFRYSDVRSANTLMDKENPWEKDKTGKDVDRHLYRSMIGSLMYLTASRPDIMFVVCACARHQVTPKECHLHAVKRIFRYLKSHPKLGIWYPKDSPFDLVAYSDSDNGGATPDRK
nr:hypothetical protein [Tanacetum cinerariifolium]